MERETVGGVWFIHVCLFLSALLVFFYLGKLETLLFNSYCIIVFEI